MVTVNYKALHLLTVIVFMGPFSSFGQSLSAEGKIEGSNNKKVYLFMRDSSNKDMLLDSTISENDRFTLTHKPEELNLYTITIDSVPGGIRFIWDRNLKIDGNSKAIWQSKVTGSPLTDDFNNYERDFTVPARAKIIAMSNSMRDPNLDQGKREELEKQQRDVVDALNLQTEKYIRENPDSFLSLFFLRGLGIDKAKEIIGTLSQELQRHSIAKAMREEIRIKEAVDAGKPAPDFTVQDMKGNEISLSHLRGQYVLLDFWGSWCTPCIKLIPETKKAYERYKGKKVQFMGVAYDEEKDRAKLSGLIEKHGMTWPQIFQDKSEGIEEGIVGKYLVSAYPSVILINPQGNIIYRGTGQNGLAEACKVLDKELY